MRTFRKADPAPLEAAGLRWLAAGGARVPEIVEDGPEALVLQNIPPGRLDAAGEEELGRMLAAVHRSGAPAHGALPAAGRFLVGRCDIPIEVAADAADLYLRVLCAPVARRVGLAETVDRVRLDVPPEPPARLHGDLWQGNVLADEQGRPWLVDPAAYGGHRETDLAMLDLFGAIPARTAAAYDEAYPLEPGWRERVAQWQLLPLLVHADLFGGSYLRRAADLAGALARRSGNGGGHG